jgi:hypothetical protein
VKDAVTDVVDDDEDAGSSSAGGADVASLKSSLAALQAKAGK